ncbi:MAG TPA: hypothetical protein VGK00_14590 [Anaerolineales bacterium]|jgi:hypothetical protein
MRRANLFWGVILILLGGLFFLKAIGLISDVLGWFWPLGFILLGVWVLVGRFLPRFGVSVETFSIDLQGATKLDVDFDHGAGSVFFGGGAPAGVAISGTQGSGLEVSSHLAGDSLGVDIDAGPTFIPFLGPDGGEWRFNLTQEVPVSIKIDAGASGFDFDMTDVRLTYLGVDTGASRIKVKLPANAGHTLLDFQSGAASIELSVPTGVGARIRLEQGASTINIDESRFPLLTSLRNVYQSVDYDSAPNKVEINLVGGANSVRVR